MNNFFMHKCQNGAKQIMSESISCMCAFSCARQGHPWERNSAQVQRDSQAHVDLEGVVDAPLQAGQRADHDDAQGQAAR